ncbi:MAG: transcriptional regulator, MerR family, partial [Frankiales bacterium]|nr:transcriptional regulator, MerR family [Frankiales bacterium]
MSIGEVLSQLRPDFADVTISKIRFLEDEGLIKPERTSSGYRKFSREDVGRLRYVLAAQRDHYLPLRVIKEHLDAIDRGLEPPALGGGGP